MADCGHPGVSDLFRRRLSGPVNDNVELGGPLRSWLPSLMEPSMSNETPKDDPRQATDWKNTKQTDKAWNGPVEKEQRPGGPPPDLEKWQETNTH